MLLKWISGFNFTGNQNWPNFLNISFVCLCWSLTLSACICMHAYVCARMCICMHERDRIELRTWLLKPPGAQSQRQNTDREIHSLHTPLASICLSAHKTSLPSSLALLSNPDLSLPILSFLYHFYVWLMHTQIAQLSRSLFPTWSIFSLVNTPLTNPSQIRSHTILSRLTADLCHSPRLSSFFPIMSKCLLA